ncbi:FAD/NAD-binding domain-containing protein [Fomitiporia mediterranea MF3/22]|uniref:FAD/NAD-binding domain-containing protein n=1 Tax=Fomitiporia mediterranea (strain MF3/22) TaxID=694068 RepID=UPI0004409983|nr:FAD/NAD-binding domain-containing protein [Fomitiporia mediterranea MF3/22]EJD03777.1 FAD/NAD-binding domain-containing protein [Fomitiporia mediterranea MF3/22]
MSKQNIVVVGGGAAGTAITILQSGHNSSDYNLILITLREVFVHLPAAIRMLTYSEDALENKALVPYDSLFSKGIGSVKIGKVVGIEESSTGSGGNVLLEGGEKVAYRYLVLATGSVWEGPLAAVNGQKQDLLSSVESWREKIKKSKKGIAIIGAGAVGLEFAGEILDAYPDKKVTIVNATPLPLNDTYPEKFRKDVLKRWHKRGVRFLLEDRIDDVPEGEFSSVATKNGQTFEADVVLATRGPRPNTAYLESLGVLDDRGCVKVDSTLQLTGHPNIFAAGDIISFKEQKQAAKTAGHVGVIIPNILSLVSGKDAKKTYGGSMEGIFVTNGKNQGAGFADALWGLTFGDRVVPMVKGKGLFVAQTRAALGLVDAK